MLILGTYSGSLLASLQFISDHAATCWWNSSTIGLVFELWTLENIVIVLVVGTLTSITLFKAFLHQRKASIYQDSGVDDLSVHIDVGQEQFQLFYSTTMETCSYSRLVLPPTCRLLKVTREINQNKISSSRRFFFAVSRGCNVVYKIVSFDFINMILHFVCRVTNAFGHRWLGWKDVILEEYGGDDETHHKDVRNHPVDEKSRPLPKKQLLQNRDGDDTMKLDSLNFPKLLPPLKSSDILRSVPHRDIVFDIFKNHQHEFEKSVPSSPDKRQRDSSASPKLFSLNGLNKVHISPLQLDHHNALIAPSTTRIHARSVDLNFFDAASNDATLKRIVRDAALPDTYGYVLGDEYLVDAKTDTPLLVFVNSKSGSQQGLMLKIQFRRLLNPIQVWDLSDGPPEKILTSFAVFTRLRILVCGGDGTVSWIISSLDKLKLQRWPPVAILPIGTGNDLARINGWGGGFWGNENLITILNHVQDAYVSLLDRWEMSIFDKNTEKCSNVKSFTNYMSIGSDAFSALQLHRLRQQSPNLFSSRILNKLWYALFGAEDAIRASCSGLHQYLTLIADGVEIPIPTDSQGLIFLNIDSYLGGTALWARGIPAFGRRSMKRRYSDGDDMLETKSTRLDEHYLEHGMGQFERITDCSSESSCQDGKIDVVSYCGNFHLGQIRVGLGAAQLLCQCSEITIVLEKRFAIQIDGEPWSQDQAQIKITRKNEPAVMLHKTAGDGQGTEAILAEVLEWAEDKNIIDRVVHNELMKEYSRRIESKTRDRRNKSKENLLGLGVM